MTDSTVRIEWRDSAAIVTLNDPAKLNAVSPGMIEAFGRILDEVEANARAMVVTGAGTSFCSGADLSGSLGEEAGSATSDAGQFLQTHINPLMMRLRDLKILWIAAVRGAAAGVGASLALAADLIVASDTAFFLQAFSRVGLVPDGGSSHLLVRTIGRARAMELMLLGERLPAEAALEWGLINRVVRDDMLEREALALAARLAGGPLSLRLVRRLAWNAVDADWATSLALERTLQLEAGRSADSREGVAAFQQRRPAHFAGR